MQEQQKKPHAARDWSSFGSSSSMMCFETLIFSDGTQLSVKDKKANGQPQEVEKMLDRMVSGRPARIEEQPDLNKNWCFHNTKKLLQRYRSTLNS